MGFFQLKLRLSINKQGRGYGGKKKRTQNGAIFYNLGVYFCSSIKSRVTINSRYSSISLKFTSF